MLTDDEKKAEELEQLAARAKQAEAEHRDFMVRELRTNLEMTKLQLSRVYDMVVPPENAYLNDTLLDFIDTNSDFLARLKKKITDINESL